jgi:hypothetical protein
MIHDDLPTLRVGLRPPGDRHDLFSWDWSLIAPLPPFRLAESGVPAAQQTVARVCCDRQALYVRFDCDDVDIWSTWSQHDDPLHSEEVVGLLISPGSEVPRHYYEFELSPGAVLFDAQIEHLSLLHVDIVTNIRWDCQGLRAGVERDDLAHHWTAILCVPWSEITPPGALPNTWRANLSRVERPRRGVHEFSCWSPPLVTPPDFHTPERFGFLELTSDF